MDGKLDLNYMIFRIVGASRWSEEALKNMPYEKVEQIYKDTIERGK